MSKRAEKSVKAQFGFEKYALAIYDTAMASGGHSEGEKAASAHDHGAANTAGKEAAAAEGQHEAEKNSVTDIITLALATVGLLGIGVVIGRKTGVKHASGNCKH